MSKTLSAIFFLIIFALFMALSVLLPVNQQAVAQDAYPPPNQPAVEAAGTDAYPVIESELAPGDESRDIETIGSGREGDPFLGLSEQPAAQPVAQDTPSPTGGVFLWLSFVAALLIFATAVFGSIVLFTRRNDA